MRSVRVALAAALILSACGDAPDSSGETTTASLEAPSTPEAAVRELMDALSDEEYERAVGVTVESQMVLIALIEGVTPDEAVLLADQAADRVAANFWEGFGEGIEELLSNGVEGLEFGTAERFRVSGTDFARVEVVASRDRRVRTFTLKEEDGWRVDPLATFAPALAGKLKAVAEAVRDHPDGALLLRLMRSELPSLEAVLEDPLATPETRQAVMAAINEIRR